MESSQELDIKKYVHLVYKKRYLFVAIMVLITSVVVAYSYVMPKKYEATSTVLIERKFLADVMKGIAVASPIDDQVQALATIMKSRPLVLKVIKDLDLDLTQKTDADVELLVKVFQKNTDIKFDMKKSNRKDMDMFIVSMTHSNPVIARDYVNALVRRYIEDSLSSKRDETYGASKFLLEQIDLFKEKINVIETKIASISMQTGTTSPDRLIVLQKRLGDLLLQYTENHPEVIKVADEIATLKGQMKALKQAPRKGGATSPDQNIQSDQQGGDNQPMRRGNEQKIRELERDRDAYRKIYEEMLAALGRSEVSAHIEVQDKGGTFNVLEPAVLPLKPIGPDRMKIILLGIVAGIGVGIGSLILLDSMDRSVKTVDALNGFGLPILAVIPHIQIPAEIKKTRIKDLALYTFTGIYYTGIAAVLVLEMLGKEIK